MSTEQQTTVEDPRAKVPGAKCSECPLLGRRIAKTSGPRDAEIAIVSRSPGAWDIDEGRPFSGPSGQLLDYLFQLYDVARADVLTTNVVLCKTDKPPRKAIECCKPRLQRELAGARTILAAGAEACKELTGKTLHATRGQRLQINGQQVVTTFNPAAALRDDSYYPGLVQDFKRACTPPPPPWQPRKVVVAEGFEDALQILNDLASAPVVAVDIETTGLAYNSRLCSIAFAVDEWHAWCLPIEFCLSQRGLAILKTWFACKSELQMHVYHNGQFDAQILREHGIDAVVDEDTMHLSHCTDERPGNHSLDYLTQNELEWPDYTPPHIKVAKKNGWTLDDAGRPFTQWNDMFQYNGTDACAVMALLPILKQRINEQSSSSRTFPGCPGWDDECQECMRAECECATSVETRGPSWYYRNVRIPAVNAYIDVERRGIPFDREKALWLAKNEVAPRLATMRHYAAELVGEEINLNSPKQVGHYLYEVLKVTDYKLNRDDAGNPRAGSVDAKHRERILDEYAGSLEVVEFVQTLDDFKRLDKIRSTYLEPLVEFIDADGRIRCDILLHGTETYRTSAQKPNLQNQPRTSDDDIARGQGWVNVRQLYYAPPGYTIVQADYSQLELRTAAVLSQDQRLLQIYLDGRDLHSEVAREFYGDGYTKQDRVLAKGVNFGALFGIRAGHFSMLYKIPYDEADRLLRVWWDRFPDLRDWAQSVRTRARTIGELTNPFGAMRRFHLITPQNLDHTLKEAVNSQVQGTAAQFATLAVVELEPMLSNIVRNPREEGIVLTVHDSIVALVRDESVHVVAETNAGGDGTDCTKVSLTGHRSHSL